jgi:hypothetical protein
MRHTEPIKTGEINPREAYLLFEANMHPGGFVSAVEMRTQKSVKGHRRYIALESLIRKGILVEVERESATITGLGGRTAEMRELTAQRVTGDSGSTFKKPGRFRNEGGIRD